MKNKNICIILIICFIAVVSELVIDSIFSKKNSEEAICRFPNMEVHEDINAFDDMRISGSEAKRLVKKNNNNINFIINEKIKDRKIYRVEISNDKKTIKILNE